MKLIDQASFQDWPSMRVPFRHCRRRVTLCFPQWEKENLTREHAGMRNEVVAQIGSFELSMIDCLPASTAVQSDSDRLHMSMKTVGPCRTYCISSEAVTFFGYNRQRNHKPLGRYSVLGIDCSPSGGNVCWPRNC